MIIEYTELRRDDEVVISAPEYSALPVTGIYIALIPGDPAAAQKRDRRDRLVIKNGEVVTYVPTRDIKLVKVDGRKRRRLAA